MTECFLFKDKKQKYISFGIDRGHINRINLYKYKAQNKI